MLELARKHVERLLTSGVTVLGVRLPLLDNDPAESQPFGVAAGLAGQPAETSPRFVFGRPFGVIGRKNRLVRHELSPSSD
jgi:hypothetical protein